MNILFTVDVDLPSILGIAGGSTKSFMPDRNTVALKIIIEVISSFSHS